LTASSESRRISFSRLSRGDLEPALLHVDAAAEEHEQLVALLALADDGLALLELPPARDAENGEQLLVGHVLEERDAAQDLGLALDVGVLVVGASRGLHREAHRGDVVLAAALEREVDQQIRKPRPLLREQLRQLVLGEIAVQAVGAEQVEIARQQIGDERVHRNRRLDADRARDDVAVLRRGHLLPGDEPALELLLNDGVIFGQLVRATVAKQVDAAVADVAHHRLLAGREQRHHRGAHAALARVARGDGVDVRARLEDGALHQLGDVLAALDGGRLGERFEQRPAALERLADGLDRLGARDLARGVPAHSIGDDVEAQRIVGEERVLIVLALAPDIGARPGADDGHEAAL
jgi:hypothetical protein